MIAEAEPWIDHPDLSTVHPLRPYPDVIAPMAGGGALAAQSQGGLSSLVPSKSITSTLPLLPSYIAKTALLKFLELPDDDPRKTPLNIFLCEDFVKYLDRCEQKGFTLKGYDTVQGKVRTVPMTYENRWGVVRRHELAEKLKRLEFWFEMQEDRPVTMITLTSFHEGFSVASAWYELNKSRVKLLKLVAKYFDSPDYFWVPEPHKSGYIHYHLAVFAEVDNYTRDNSKHVGWVRCRMRQDEDIWELMDGQGIEDKFRDLWSKKYKTGNHSYGLDFSQKKDDNKIQSLKNYLTKYLEKGFLMKEWSIGQLIFNANLHETGFRMYGASTAIRKIINIEDNCQRCDVIYEWKENEFHTILDDLGKGYAELIEKRTGQDMVWLETRLESLEITPEGEEVNIDKVIWYRQYIPDWLDSDFWVWKGELRIVDPPPIYIFEWGRKLKGNEIIQEPVSWQEARRLRNKDTAWSDAPSGMRQGDASKYYDKYGEL